MGRYNSSLTLRAPRGPLMSRLFSIHRIVTNEKISKLIDYRELVVRPLDEREREKLGLVGLNIHALIQLIEVKMEQAKDEYGNHELHCLRKYMKEPSEEGIVEFRESASAAANAMTFICHAIQEATWTAASIDFKANRSKEWSFINSKIMRIVRGLAMIRWVNTPVLYALFALESLAIAWFKENKELSTHFHLWGDDIDSMTDAVSQIIHLNNYKVYLPQYFKVLTILRGSPEKRSINLALSAISAVDDLNEEKEAIEPLIKFLTVNGIFDVPYYYRSHEMPFALSPMLHSVAKIKSHPADFEIHVLKCIALLGSSNPYATETVKLYPYLLDRTSVVHGIYLKWLERIFNINQNPIGTYRKMCKTFMNSARLFRKFMGILTGHIARSAGSSNISEEARSAISLLSAMIITFDTQYDLNQTILLISFFKLDHYMLLNVLLEIHLQIKDDIEKEIKIYIENNPSLQTASAEKRILATVLGNVNLECFRVKDLDFSTVLAMYADGDKSDLLNTFAYAEPQQHHFPQLTLLAKTTSLLYWLAREDLDCNDIIKDDIDDLTTPILTFSKFLVYDDWIQSIHIPKDTDYDTWSDKAGKISEEEEVVIDNPNIDKANDPQQNLKYLRKLKDQCPNISWRMLRLIGRFDVINAGGMESEEHHV